MLKKIKFILVSLFVFSFASAAYAADPAGVTTSIRQTESPLSPNFSILVGTVALAILLLGILIIVIFFISLLKNYRILPRNDAFVFAWKKVLEQIKFFLLPTLFLVVATNCGIVFDAIAKSLFSIKESFTLWPGNINLFSVSLFFFSFLLSSWITFGYIYIALKHVDGKPSTLPDIFSQWRNLARYIVCYMLYIISICIGGLFLLIPGILLAVLFYFWPYFILDGESIIQSFVKSMKATRGMIWELFLFLFLLNMINFIGMLLFGVGVFITIPFTTLAAAHIYRSKIKTLTLGV